MGGKNALTNWLSIV